jgi:hypothetical protein
MSNWLDEVESPHDQKVSSSSLLSLVEIKPSTKLPLERAPQAIRQDPTILSKSIDAQANDDLPFITSMSSLTVDECEDHRPRRRILETIAAAIVEEGVKLP